MVKGVKRGIFMHRLLAGAVPGQTTDHKNRITLDNQRHNLRLGTHTQNMGNSGMQSRNKSGYKGVSWDKVNRRWVAQAGKTDGGRGFIGRFKTATEAAAAYDATAKKKWGEFALTNRMLGLLPKSNA
jgi:hypothetical protein